MVGDKYTGVIMCEDHSFDEYDMAIKPRVSCNEWLATLEAYAASQGMGLDIGDAVWVDLYEGHYTVRNAFELMRELDAS